MKIQFDREKFLAALTLVVATEDAKAQSKIAVDQIGTCLVAARSMRSLIGTEVSVPGVKTDEAGTIYTSLAKLAAVLGASSAKEGVIVLDGTKATLKIGRSTIKLAIGDAGSATPVDFPTDAPRGALTVPAAGFLKAIGRVIPAIDPARADALAGAFCYAGFSIGDEKERLILVGGTHKHITEVSCPLNGPSTTSKAVLPVPALQQMAKVTTGTENATIEFYDSGIVYRQGTTRVLAPVLISEYVDYKKIVPPRNGVYAVMTAPYLQEVVRRIGILDEQKVGVKITLAAGTVNFRLGSGNVPILEDSVETPEVKGEANEWYNPDDLGYILDAAGKDSKVRLEFNGNARPMVATFEGDRSYLTVAMPMVDPGQNEKAAA